MDASFLSDLLECSVCLEQLDGTSRVLPCQHTFCKSCLEEIVHSHKELRCPECRVKVEVNIEELPCNILLIRLLEGIKNNTRSNNAAAALAVATAQSVDAVMPLVARTITTRLLSSNCNAQPAMLNQRVDNTEAKIAPKQFGHVTPCAKALYSYEAKEPGDLAFKKGDIILLKKRIDVNWYQGELNTKCGYLPASYVQVLAPAASTPPPVVPPQCKALYDFCISRNDEQDCLTFNKGDVLNVIRRIDENWAEGKHNERIGIFPVSFVQMNAAARTIMKLSANTFCGPSRIAPPTPSSSSSECPTRPTNEVHQTNVSCVSAIVSSAIDTNTTSTTTMSPSSHSPGTTPCTSSSSPIPTPPTAIAPPTVSHDPLHSVPVPHMRNASSLLHNREKRLSLATVGSSGGQGGSSGSANHRHSLEILNMADCQEQTDKNTQVCEIPSRANRRSNRSKDSPSNSTPNINQTFLPSCLPNQAAGINAYYVALYNYKPQKDDELELRKGELYTVSEKCQDGWFKGVSIATARSGVFPGNYVHIAKAAPIASGVANVRSMIKTGTPTNTAQSNRSSKPVDEWSKSKDPKVVEGQLKQWRQWDNLAASSSSSSSESAPPTSLAPPLAPRCSTPTPATTMANSYPLVSMATSNQSCASSPGPAASHEGFTSSVGTVGNNQSWHGPTLFGLMSTVTPPNVTITQVEDIRMPERKKEKEKVSLMKRFTSKRKSRSPPPSNYSCDNPSFVDTPPHHQTQPPPPPPTQYNTPPGGGQQKQTTQHVRSGSCPSEAFGGQPSSHKKTPSLDGSSNETAKGSSYRSKQPPPLVRERFRCIVPYPPHSELELELRVGDIVYVHKKRDDGWYKGTLQRTGRTGLFPKSFVDSY